MSVSTETPERLRIGQLLLHHLRLFREQLLAEARTTPGGDGFELRMPHLHVFGNIKAEGTRLTDLAAMAGMTRPSMVALVDELEQHGLLERQPDPTDKRAKLIALTPTGWDAIRTGRSIIEAIEADYARRVGPERFEAMCQTLQDLLDDRSGERVRSTPPPPP
jgi:DNA-binding MarR family transcriptional regulator